jgi:hypothetical protein
MRELQAVPLAQQEPERACATAVVGRRLAHAAGQQRDCGLHLGLAVVLADRRVDELAGDAGLLEPRTDPLGTPAVERATVVDEVAGVADVVDGALASQLGERRARGLGVAAMALEQMLELRGRLVAALERAVAVTERRVERRRNALRAAFGRLAQAACSWGASAGTGAAAGASPAAVGAASRSIGVTRSFVRPSAA